MMQNKKQYYNVVFFLLYGIAITVFYFLIFWNYSAMGSGADYKVHAIWAEEFFVGEFEIMYPGYYWMLGFFMTIFHVDVHVAGCIVCTIASVISVVLTRMLLKYFLNSADTKIWILSFMLNVIQPIFWYGYGPGWSSGNSLVSPTQVLVKPLVLLCFYLFLRIYDRYHYLQSRDISFTRDKEIWILNICQIASLLAANIAKPIYNMALVPAMAIFLFIDIILKEKRKPGSKFKTCIWLFFPYFISGIVLILQYIYAGIIESRQGTLAGGDSYSFSIRFLYEWGSAVDNVWISILMAYAFPVILLICLGKKIQYDRKDLFTISYMLVSFFYIAFFCQATGTSRTVNFRNGWVWTFTYVYLICIVKYWRYIQNRAGKYRAHEILPAVVFLVQTAFGLAYALRAMGLF